MSRSDKEYMFRDVYAGPPMPEEPEEREEVKAGSKAEAVEEKPYPQNHAVVKPSPQPVKSSKKTTSSAPMSCVYAGPGMMGGAASGKPVEDPGGNAGGNVGGKTAAKPARSEKKQGFFARLFKRQS